MIFQAGSATSNAVLTIDVRGVWTLPCLRAISGVSDIDLASTCANIDQNYADNPVFSASSCMVVGQTCDCMVTSEQQFSLGDAYTVKGSEITFAGDPSKTTYCVSGSMLRMSSMSMGEGAASGTITLTRAR
jgi:hypothetical protein